MNWTRLREKELGKKNLMINICPANMRERDRRSTPEECYGYLCVCLKPSVITFTKAASDGIGVLSFYALRRRGCFMSEWAGVGTHTYFSRTAWTSIPEEFHLQAAANESRHTYAHMNRTSKGSSVGNYRQWMQHCGYYSHNHLCYEVSFNANSLLL